jgi:hypothetical protein
MKISDEQKVNFLLEEYKMLRMEIESYSNQKRQLEIYIVSAILVIYGWVSTLTEPTMKNIALYSPILLVVFGIYRFYFCNKVIEKQAEYVKYYIEQEFFLNNEKGWESFWQKSNTLPILRWGEYLFWFSLLVMSIMVAIITK